MAKTSHWKHLRSQKPNNALFTKGIWESIHVWKKCIMERGAEIMAIYIDKFYIWIWNFCQNFIRNNQLTGPKILLIQNHMSYTFSAILQDNKNCQICTYTWGILTVPGMNSILEKKLFNCIPELKKEILTALVPFFEARQNTLKTIRVKAPNIVSTFP